MGKHTPEPWALLETPSGSRIISNGESFSFNGRESPQHIAVTCKNYGETTSTTKPYREGANAARIVACINACAGIPTKQLEAGCVERLRFAAQVTWNEIEDTEYGEPITVSGEAGGKLKAALAPFQKESDQ